MDKTVENVVAEPKVPVKNIFGNRPAKKRKNIFADFIVSDSEHEVSDIQVQAKQILLKRKKNNITEDQVDDGKKMEVSLNLQEMVRQKYNASQDVNQGDEVDDIQDSDQRHVDKDIESQKYNFESKDGKEVENKQTNDLTNRSTVKEKTMDRVDNTGLGFDNDKTSEKSDTESNASLKLTYDSEGHQEIDENRDANKAIATDAMSEQHEQEKMKVNNCDNIKSTEKIHSNINIEPNKSLELASRSKVLEKIDEIVDTDKVIEADGMSEQDDEENMAVDNYEIEKNTCVDKQKSTLIVADKTVENKEDSDNNEVDAELEESEVIDTDQHKQTNPNNDRVKENKANTEHDESGVDTDQNADNEVDNNRLGESEIDENEVNEVEDDKSQGKEVDNGDAKLEESQLDDNENKKEVDNDEMEVDDEKEKSEVGSDKNVEEVDENEKNDAKFDESRLDNNEKEENEVGNDKNGEVDDNEIEVDAELDESQLENNEKEENEVDSDKNGEEDEGKLKESQSDNDENEGNSEVDSDKNEEHEVDSDNSEENALDNDENEEENDESVNEVENEDNEIEKDENEEGVEHEESEVDYDEDEVDNDENDKDDEHEQSEEENDQMEENEVDSDVNEDTGVDDDDNEVEDESNEDGDENQEHPSRVISSDEVVEESPNVTHDTTGRNRKKVKSPEVALHDKTKQETSFIAKGRNTSIRETKTMYKDLNIRSSMAPHRDSLGLSEGDSSAEGSGWDSHRTTRKTLRQTFGKDFTPRKSLRALVMEKSAKRTTNVPQSESVLVPQANSTEFPQDSHSEVDVTMESGHITMESDHEVSRRTRQTTLETYLQKMKQQNLAKKLKMVSLIKYIFK